MDTVMTCSITTEAANSSCNRQLQALLDSFTSGNWSCSPACHWSYDQYRHSPDPADVPSPLISAGDFDHPETCPVVRIGVYGSSHDRVIALALLSLLQRSRVSEADYDIPSMNLPPGHDTCDNAIPDPHKPLAENNCQQPWALQRVANFSICRYPYDVGATPKACGFPSGCRITSTV